MRLSLHRLLLVGLLLAVALPFAALAPAQPAKPSTPALDLRPEGISGALVLCGGGKTPDAVFDRFMQLAGGDKAKLVIIPTASETADKPDAAAAAAKPWQDRKAASVAVLHSRDRKQADDAKFVEPLKQATGVWISGGQQSRLAEAYLGTAVEKELHALLKRGGVVGGTSAGSAIMSRAMIAGGKEEPELATGFDLLPGCIIDQHYKARNRQARLHKAIEKHPHLFGVGIDEGTALVVQGRGMRVLGDSTVSIILSKSDQRPLRNDDLKTGQLADLTMLRRAALARSQPRFPPLKLADPVVKSGSLVIVGGGGMPGRNRPKACPIT
jgi:cyanophycinase